MPRYVLHSLLELFRRLHDRYHHHYFYYYYYYYRVWYYYCSKKHDHHNGHGCYYRWFWLERRIIFVGTYETDHLILGFFPDGDFIEGERRVVPSSFRGFRLCFDTGFLDVVVGTVNAGAVFNCIIYFLSNPFFCVTNIPFFSIPWFREMQLSIPIRTNQANKYIK